MTSSVIYHDFRNSNPVPATAEPASTVFLTASVLSKGRRLAAINHALNIACITLCGACIGVSVLIITNLMFG